MSFLLFVGKTPLFITSRRKVTPDHREAVTEPLISLQKFGMPKRDLKGCVHLKKSESYGCIEEATLHHQTL